MHVHTLKMCRSRQVYALLMRMPTIQLTLKLCCIGIYIVCTTSEVMKKDSFNGGMGKILRNLNYISLNVMSLQAAQTVFVQQYTLMSCIPVPPKHEQSQFSFKKCFALSTVVKYSTAAALESWKTSQKHQRAISLNGHFLTAVKRFKTKNLLNQKNISNLQIQSL